MMVMMMMMMMMIFVGGIFNIITSTGVGSVIIYGSLFLIVQWPSDLRRGSATVRLLGLRVRLPRREHGCLSLASVVLSGLCVGPIPRPEESYRLWCVNVCCLET
jgi:hypothetical protein